MADIDVGQMMQRMSYAEYVAVPGVRWSHLKEMRTSRLHYKVRSRQESPDTPSQVLGRAAHAAVFEPELFEAEYVVCDLNRRTNAWKEFRAEHDVQTILKTPERDGALRIAEAVRAHGPAAEILAAGQAERVITWTDPATGIARKAKLDWVTTPDMLTLADLKTAADIGDKAFGRAAATYCYHGQVVDYTWGLREVTGLEYKPVIIAVENKEPYDVRVADVTGAELTAAENLVRELHDKLAEAMRTDTWPGQFPERGKLNLPSWELWDDDAVSGEIEVISR
jgi:hypothetical protein